MASTSFLWASGQASYDKFGLSNQNSSEMGAQESFPAESGNVFDQKASNVLSML